MTKIVCPGCKQLVEVVDRSVVKHLAAGLRCPNSSSGYRPQRSRSSEDQSPFARPPSNCPEFEVLAAKELTCGDCGESTGVMAALVRVTPPVNSLN